MTLLKLKNGRNFPELKEDNNKIKEALIDLVKCYQQNGYMFLNNISTDSMITWLENQENDNNYNKYKSYECSNEDNEMIERCCWAIESVGYYDDEEIYEIENWLKSHNTCNSNLNPNKT